MGLDSDADKYVKLWGVWAIHAFLGISGSNKDGMRIVDDLQRLAEWVAKFLNLPALQSECGLRAWKCVQPYCR